MLCGGGFLPDAARLARCEQTNEQIPLFFPLLAQLPCSVETAIATCQWNLLFSLLEPAGGIS